MSIFLRKSGFTVAIAICLLAFGVCNKNPVKPTLASILSTIVMKDIPAGTFTMGSDSFVDYNAQPPHQVTLSGFKMEETDVTQEQFRAVMDSGASSSPSPMEPVSWFDAVRFCNALSKFSGLDTVYNTTTWAANFTKNGYRLPTEAQWEYACRAGSTEEYWWGSDTNGMGARAWSYNNSDSGSTIHPVGAKLANAYGLYDMTGNVWQWCNDWFGNYKAGAATDPTGPATGMYHVLRGGSFVTGNVGIYDEFRSAYRYYYGTPYPAGLQLFSGVVGFRVVLPQ
jgi:formylglycine-generating enzyme